MEILFHPDFVNDFQQNALSIKYRNGNDLKEQFIANTENQDLFQSNTYASHHNNPCRQKNKCPQLLTYTPIEVR